MHAPLISIIIPTFNAESYIARCLESCINQTLHDIEILIIDDCGSDDSIQIAKDYASKDKRIKIIQNPKNLGTFWTRMEGIRYANGEYVLFLDADDYLDLRACEKSYQQVLAYRQNNTNNDRENDVDIVHFGMRFYPSTFIRVSPPVITQTLRGDEVLHRVFAHCATPPWHICAKLYKASRIKSAREIIVAHMGEDTHLKMAEDVLHCFYICALAKSSIGIKDKLYVYCHSASSITRKTDPITRDKKVSDIKHIIAELQRLDSVSQVRSNAYFKPAQTQTINILKSVCALEYRYDDMNAYNADSVGGGGKFRCLKYAPSYLRACLDSLKYHRKWQTYVRILAYLITFGRMRI